MSHRGILCATARQRQAHRQEPEDHSDYRRQDAPFGFGEARTEDRRTWAAILKQLKVGKAEARADSATHEGVRTLRPSRLPPSCLHAAYRLLFRGWGAQSTPLQPRLAWRHQ